MKKRKEMQKQEEENEDDGSGRITRKQKNYKEVKELQENRRITRR